MDIKIFGVYLADFKKNIGGEINNQRYCIAISEVSSKDNTLLVVPITGKKSGTKYRGGFTIDNTKYQIEPKYEKCFAKVRKIREISKNRIKGNSIYELDEYDKNQSRDSIKKVIKIDICRKIEDFEECSEEETNQIMLELSKLTDDDLTIVETEVISFTRKI